uniref:Protein kinase domain-containing protein n=1 Tax=Hordeum vulgare subsp. vulgare TaxID=112509 RepID=A0A8I7B8G5_HORVV
MEHGGNPFYSKKKKNILLDDNMIPKIVDFGLSRLLDQQQTIHTSSLGTFGYMAPEFVDRGTITPKSDIFSLGVIIIEIIMGHRDYPDVITTTPSDDFVELVLGKWKNRLARSQRYGNLEIDCQQIKRCVQIGLICVNPDRTKRPPARNIINMLQGSGSIV